METEKLSGRIIEAFNNRENISQEEIDELWEEVKEYMKALPSKERGAFHWRSGAEAFFLLTSESKGVMK